MRVLAFTAALVSVLPLAGWTAGGDVSAPRNCTAAETRQRAVLTTEDPTDGSGAPAYFRYCGPAHAVVRVRGISYAIGGGFCGHRYSQTRWLYFGLTVNGARPGARGLSLVLRPANKDGRVNIIDSIVQVGGLDLAPRGIAVQSNGLRVGTFSGVWKGTHVTGSWVCETGSFGDVRVAKKLSAYRTFPQQPPKAAAHVANADPLTTSPF